MPYLKQTWADGSGGGTPVNAERLNHIEDGIEAIDLAVTAAADVTFTPAGTIGATDVQAALEELDNDVLELDNDVAGAQGDASTAISNLAAHLVDISDAHDASAISFVPAGTISSTTVQEAIEELDAGGGGGASDPYGLLSNPSALAADEHDDATIDAAYVQVAPPGSGTLTWAEDNHRLSGVAVSVSANQGGAILLPLSSMGSSLSVGSILETSLLWNSPNTIVTGRVSWGISDGTTSSSNFISFHRESSSNTIYTVNGTVQHPFATSFASGGISYSPDLRIRVKMVSSNVYRFYWSLDGVSWFDMYDSNTNCEYTLGWTPTHVGLHLQGQAVASMDYIRRIA